MAEQKKDDKKKKKSKVWLFLIPVWVLLGLFVLSLIPPAVVFILAYDGRKNVTEYPQTTVEEIGSKNFLRGLNSISDDGILTVGITKNDINGVIVQMSKDLTNIEGIDNLYILTNDEGATVYLEVSAKNYFRTRLSVGTGFEMTDDSFILQIKDVKMGAITLPKDMALKVLDLLKVDYSKIGTGDKGFKLDIPNWRILIDKKLLINSIESGSGQGTFVTKLFKMVENNHLITFGSSVEDFIHMNINLGKLRNNPNLTNDDNHLIINKPSSIYANIGVDEIKAEIGGKLDKMAPYCTGEELKKAFQFLFKGYDYCDDATKSFIENFETRNQDVLRSIGINDVTKYESYMAEIDKNSGSILGNAKAQISYASIGNSQVCKIYESDINNYIRSLGIIGYGDVVHFGNGDATQYGYFLVDNFYSNIIDDQLYFTVGLNINGFETYILMHLEQIDVPAQPSKAFFKIDDIHFGEVDASELMDSVLDILKGAGSSGEGVIGFTTVEDQPCFYFDMSFITEKIHEFTDLISPSSIKLFANGNDIQEEGYFSVEIS